MSLYVGICMYLYVCVHMCVYVYMYIYIFLYICIYVYVYVGMYICICMYIYLYICVYLYRYIYSLSLFIHDKTRQYEDCNLENLKLILAVNSVTLTNYSCIDNKYDCFIS